MEFILREWRETDLDSLVKYANNYNIARFLTDGFPHPYTREDGKAFLTSLSKEPPINVFAIEIDGEAVGSIGTFQQADVHRKNAEMGYWLAEPHWGKGIMTEAIKRMTEYTFENFDVTRIFARPYGINLGSQRVLQKAGFTLEARFKDALYKYDEYIDELIFAIRRK